MKYEIRKMGHTAVIKTVEAKSAYDAIKKISGNMATIANCPSFTAKYGVPVFSKGWEGHLHRNHFTVTPVIEATAPVIMTIEETATATMMTYTDAQLMDIVATHSLRNSKVDRILTEAAARELAGR